MKVDQERIKAKSSMTESAWIDSEQLNKQRKYNVIKRIIDVVFGILGLMIISPIMVYIAYKIKREDPSSNVIFRQVRIGKDGVPFTMYKFRSMCPDAESQLTDILHKNEVKGAMFKIQEDPRITKFGKFIRKTSLDELPQLVNVVRGEMSLIGPRPPLKREVSKYTQYDKQRLLVKPGCSGLWQVSGRSNVNFNEMVNLDILYIKKRTIFYDLGLMIQTIKTMLIPNGSY